MDSENAKDWGGDGRGLSRDIIAWKDRRYSN